MSSRNARSTAFVFGSAPFLVILGAMILVIITAGRARTIAYHRLVAWSGAILALQAGVRRGLSFDPTRRCTDAGARHDALGVFAARSAAMHHYSSRYFDRCRRG